jgi:hypothetical protein
LPEAAAFGAGVDAAATPSARAPATVLAAGLLIEDVVIFKTVSGYLRDVNRWLVFVYGWQD